MKLISKPHIVACILFAVITLSSDYSLFVSEAFAQTPTQTPVANNQNTVVSGSAQRREYTLLEPLPCVNGPEGTVTEGITCENGYVKKVNLYAILGYAYRLLLAIASILAVVMIMYGGVQYMTTEAFTGKSEAKETIKNAVIGLFMTLGSFLFLQTIDPKITELAQDPLPPIGVDRKFVFDPQTLVNLLKNESERAENLRRASANITKEGEEASQILDDVSGEYAKDLAKITQEINALRALDVQTNESRDRLRSLINQEQVLRRKKVLSTAESQVIENFNELVEELEDIDVPSSETGTWNRSKSVLSNDNPEYKSEIDSDSSLIFFTAPYQAAKREIDPYGDTLGLSMINSRQVIFKELLDFAKSTIDLEKRYEAFANRTATQGAKASEFAIANNAQLQGVLNGINTRTTSVALNQKFGTERAVDPAAKFYEASMKFYAQRLENIKATYK